MAQMLFEALVGHERSLTPRVARGGYRGRMSDDLTPRRPSRLSRSQRETRGFRLVAVGGVAGAAAVVGAVLAIIGVIGWGLPFIAVVVTAICAFLFRRLTVR
jgi:hypothetical protein